MKPVGKCPLVLVSLASNLAAEGLVGHLCVKSLEVKYRFGRRHAVVGAECRKQWEPSLPVGGWQDWPPTGLPLAARVVWL